MALEVYELLRQFGRDVGGAMAAGPKAKFEGAKLKYDIDTMKDERATKEEELAKKKRQDAARERLITLTKSGDTSSAEWQATALEAGESPLAIAQAIKAQREKTNKPDRYDLNRGFVERLGLKMNDVYGKVLENSSGGKNEDPSVYQAAIDQYNSIEKLLKRLSLYDTGADATYTAGLAMLSDEVLRDTDEARIELIASSVTGALGQYKSGQIKDLADRMQANETKYSKYANTAGIPSRADIKNLFFGLVLDGDQSKEALTTLMNVRDPEKLAEIAQDKDVPEGLQVMAMMLLKNALGARAVGVTVEPEAKNTKKKSKKRWETNAEEDEGNVPAGTLFPKITDKKRRKDLFSQLYGGRIKKLR